MVDWDMDGGPHLKGSTHSLGWFVFRCRCGACTPGCRPSRRSSRPPCPSLASATSPTAMTSRAISSRRSSTPSR
eukprot:5256149-Pyramimonas_sp.AAC.1